MQDGDTANLLVADDGVGLPPDFDPERDGKLGMELMINLAGQLGGRLEIDGSDGVRIGVSFPLDNSESYVPLDES